MGDWQQAILILLVMIVVAFLIPAKFDPAIRLKELCERWAERREK